jgi:hypothetical protein
VSWPKWLGMKSYWAYRRATSSLRSKPDFIIIGAQKSGTTSLFAGLSQHPKLLPSIKKEVHFFDGGLSSRFDTFSSGVHWYRAHFPIKRPLRWGFKTFEASPSYVFNPLTPKRIARLLPNVKLIVMLRNPTQRAISHYYHAKRVEGREPMPLREALDAEEGRLSPDLKESQFNSDELRWHSYKRRGLYKQQLDVFLEHFPREQILVFASEELFTDPDRAMRKVFEFVGVDSDVKVSDLKPRNVSNNSEDVEPEIYAYLNDYFHPHNQELFRLIGSDLGW